MLFKVVKAEKAEKKVFKAIEKYFSNINEEVVVLYSFYFMGTMGAKNLEPREKDFILVNLTKRYIMPLEVKTTYHKEALKKALKQVGDTMKLMNEWVGGDLTEECGWQYIPVICFESRIDEVEQEFCSESIKYIIYGDELDDQVEKLLDGIPSGLQTNPGNAREEFVKVAEFLLFFASFEPVVTPFYLSQKVAENVDRG